MNTLAARWPASPGSFFIAGLMQGARRGADLSNQSYRNTLSTLLRERFPQAAIHDPGQVMWREMQHPRDVVKADHAALGAQSVVRREHLAPSLVELTRMFHRLTDLAAQSDVCIAWLPDHEPSMGTAAEIFAAHRAGRRVVAITEMKQTLAVLACAEIIVPDLPAFQVWLDETYRG